MSDYVPRDVLINILTRLPIKSMLRFRCVCSSWNSLMTSSNFVARHLDRTSISKNQLVVTRHFSKKPKIEYYSFRLDNENLDEYFKVDFPFKCSSSDFKVVGSIRGLICVVEDYMHYTLNLFLWNPSIRRCITLPNPHWTLKTCARRQVVLGFGFDTKTSDYKVLRMMNLQKENRNCNVCLVAELYSINSGSWKKIHTFNHIAYYGIRHYQTTQTHVNGILHWLAWNGRRTTNMVLSFDLGDETFKEIKLPDCLSHWWTNRDINISALGDTIAIFENNLDDNVFHVWVMKQYGLVDSWTKQFTIQLSGGLQRPFDFRNNGDVLFSRICERDVFSYDIETGKICYLEIFTTYESFFYSNLYVESLVLIDKANCLHPNNGVQKTCYRKAKAKGKIARLGLEHTDVKMGRRREADGSAGPSTDNTVIVADERGSCSSDSI